MVSASSPANKGERVQLWSRRSTDLTYRFLAIAEAVRGLAYDIALIVHGPIRATLVVVGWFERERNSSQGSCDGFRFTQPSLGFRAGALL